MQVIFPSEFFVLCAAGGSRNPVSTLEEWHIGRYTTAANNLL